MRWWKPLTFPRPRRPWWKRWFPPASWWRQRPAWAGFGDTDALVTRRVRDNFYVVGDGRTECGGKTPPLSPRVGIVAAKQADVVLGYFLEQYVNQEGVM